MGIRVLAISKGLGSAIPVYADSSAQVDFFIHGYTKLRFLGQDVYFTTTHISMIIVILANSCICVICKPMLSGKQIQMKYRDHF